MHLFTPVIATTQRADGSWDVETDKGTIHADVVVNAAGLWAREVAAMAGVELPLMPLEHQYLVTEKILQGHCLCAATSRLRNIKHSIILRR